MRDTKIRIAVTVTGWMLAAIIQAVSFAFFFGRLSQKVEDLKEKVDAMERARRPGNTAQQKSTEVKKYGLEKDSVVRSGGAGSCHREQRLSEQRQRRAHPFYLRHNPAARDSHCAEVSVRSVHDSPQPAGKIADPASGAIRRPPGADLVCLTSRRRKKACTA
jgi:hypothetical protein